MILLNYITLPTFLARLNK